MTLQDIKTRLREGPYAWPGGYPLFFIAHDGEPLSFAAVRERFREVCAAHLTRDERDQWFLTAVEPNWENPDLYCAHTGERIPSAYAEPDQ